MTKNELVLIQTALLSYIDMHHSAAKTARIEGEEDEAQCCERDALQYEQLKAKIDQQIIEPNLFKQPMSDLIEASSNLEYRLSVVPHDPSCQQLAKEQLEFGYVIVRRSFAMHLMIDDALGTSMSNQTLQEYMQAHAEEIVNGCVNA